MKEKKICIYLIFWFADKASVTFQNLSTYGITKSGDEYVRLACSEKVSKRYIDFSDVLNDFIEKCKKDEVLIKRLINEADGKFNIEIIPEMSAYTSTPSIILDKELIDFINSLKDKFGYIEIDSYVI